MSSYQTIAFYNIENLFDTVDNPNTADDDFLPTSQKRWTLKRYNRKIQKLGFAISKIGRKNDVMPPAIIGLAEVENQLVLNDLANSKALQPYNYKSVHYDSKDERGIDVALLYNAAVFTVISSKTFSINLLDEAGLPDYSRDILLVKGLLNQETINVIVNHWPSRREGLLISEEKRMIASRKTAEIISEIKAENTDAKIIIMGDFNDNPKNKSITSLVKTHQLHNPMLSLMSTIRGSLVFKKEWFLFDQILFTTNFFQSKKGTHSFSSTDIFDADFLKTFKGKLKGNPFRTFIWKFYKGGYSDHFPVYIRLKKN